MQPLVDGLYLLVSLALIVVGAVVVAVRLRGLGRYPLVGVGALVALALLVLALEPMRGTAVPAVELDELEVGAARPRLPAPDPGPRAAPPVMRRVPIPPATVVAPEVVAPAGAGRPVRPEPPVSIPPPTTAAPPAPVPETLPTVSTTVAPTTTTSTQPDPESD